MSTKYDNTDWCRLSKTGGVTTALIIDGIGRGNGGVSLPCKGCFVQPRVVEGGDVWLTAPPEFSIGPFLPGVIEGCQPMWIPVSDVAQLFFGGNSGDTVDIVYLLG
jgi:hypothetical protein